MRVLLAIAILFASPAVAGETDVETQLEKTRLFLDSRIGAKFPDAAIRSLGPAGPKTLSPLTHNGLLVVYVNSPCPWAVKAAETMNERDGDVPLSVES